MAARPRTKEYKPVTIRMEMTVYDRLSDFCEESGQPKTVAIERALNMYMDDYEKKQALPWSKEYRQYEIDQVEANRHLLDNLFPVPDKPTAPNDNKSSELQPDAEIA